MFSYEYKQCTKNTGAIEIGMVMCFDGIHNAQYGNVWKSSVKELGRCWFVRPTLFPRVTETFNDVLVPSQTTVNDPFLPRFHQFRLKKKKRLLVAFTTSTLNRYIFDWYLTRRVKILREALLPKTIHHYQLRCPCCILN